MNQHPRLTRENRTVDLMIRLYCRKQHAQTAPCPECRELQEYARLKLEKCPFRENKPTCAKCKVHCYKPEMRARIKKVMRFSGPRMLLYHPVLAIRHLLDGRQARNI